ncbi:hypothetical protein ACGFIR_30650 [Micromonospora sp. NPDC049051]|uniref:hypothetical protein n=1 Tax=Micromonospora sp. NPDC049051 TaxID=3364264 RepID=UPI00371F38F7
MLWPALRVLSQGELTSDQLQHLLSILQLEQAPRIQGPGAAKSIAHRAFADSVDTRLILDLARAGESGWVLTLLFEGEPPSADAIQAHRALLVDTIEQCGLTLIEVAPAATADQVHVPPQEPIGTAEPGIGPSWDLPYDNLDQLWPHVGLRKDAPRDVKAVKLREVMRSSVWSAAPPALQRQAESFLRDA